MSYWRDLTDRQKSYWKDLAGRIAAFVKSNYRTWAVILFYSCIFCSQFAFILFLSKDIPDPDPTFVFVMPFGIAIGVIISFILACVELILLFDYEKFKERRKIQGEEKMDAKRRRH